MSLLSFLHITLNLAALLLGVVILVMRKGTARHRLLGWIYVAAMCMGLGAILLRTRLHPPPFAVYAVFILGVLAASILSARFGSLVRAWRSWHAGLMLLSFLGSIMAAASIAAGVIAAAPSGPIFYQLFNIIICVFTLLALGIIWRSSVLWGVEPRPAEAAARRHYLLVVVTSSSLLVLAQWPLAFP